MELLGLGPELSEEASVCGSPEQDSEERFIAQRPVGIREDVEVLGNRDLMAEGQREEAEGEPALVIR